MERKQGNDSEHGEGTTENADHDPEPVDAEDVGLLGGSGGPASIIYGEDDEADEHGDRLARGPEESA